MNIVAYKEIEYSRVLFSELNRDMRVDAEYFDPFHLRFEELEKKRPRSKIKGFAAVTDGIHDSIAFDDSSTINLISAKAPKENTFELGGTGYISKKQHEKNPRTALRLDDVVISTVGTIGNCAVVESDILPANSDRHVGIIRIGNTDVLPRYVSTYFVTKYGRSATKRETAGNVQPNLYIRNIADLAIPIPSLAFQKQIENLILKANQQKQLADKLYADAENLLLKELGLLDWKPETVRFTLGGREFEVESTVAKITSVEMLKTERIDAEYFQPKYDNLLAIAINNACYVKTVKEIQCFNSRGLQPLYDENGTLDIINSRHIQEQFLDYDNFEKTDISSWEKQKRGRVYKGDILIYTTGANIGRANVFMSERRALASNHVNILRTREECAYYVGFVLNSIIGRLQTDKMCAGSAQVELYPKDINKFVVPFVVKSVQKEMISNCSKSFAARNKSRQLLNQAKHAVELFIEEGEEAALKLLEP